MAVVIFLSSICKEYAGECTLKLRFPIEFLQEIPLLNSSSLVYQSNCG